MVGRLLRALLLLPLLAGESGTAEPDRTLERDYSLFAGMEYPTALYWGDTHVHSNLSADGNLGGNLDLGPEEAYRFARGEEVISQSGQRAKLARPLDFVVLADHAEGLGLLPLLRSGDARLLQVPALRRIYEGLSSRDPKQVQRAAWALGSALMERGEDLFGGEHAELGRKLAREAWQRQLALAERFDAPGLFTAMIGFEYSPTPDGANLHRNVIFRDGAARAGQILPFSAAESLDVVELWRFMEDYERKTGGQVLAIPHNANMSNGIMFRPEDARGRPIDAAYAETRARWEPLFEVTQIKGDQETHPVLSPDDEFADFERFDKTNSFGNALKQDWMLEYEYARSVLTVGLRLAREIGVNPYRFGLIGSSDTHTALPGSVAEDDFWGKGSDMEPGQGRMEGAFMPARVGEEHSFMKVELGASGLAAVWATANTRESIFDAMRRREVYATTGSRITLRFFGGWNFEPDDASDPHLARVGYAKGVAMGSDLRGPPGAEGRPSFLIAALRDPEGANLDRIQIIKGWFDDEGGRREKIYDVRLSGGRLADADGRVAPVGSTVDPKQASFRNTIGAAELSTVWVDPDFDENRPAFYYARVIEIPRPRWSTREAAFYGLELPDGVPATVQDRAYSSPIWYAPGH